MPFEKINVKGYIDENLQKDPELKELWDRSRTEYKLLGELIRLRKEKGLSQSELALLSKNKQQVISRIENREHSPTLKTICNIADALGVDIKFVPRQQMQLALPTNILNERSDDPLVFLTLSMITSTPVTLKPNGKIRTRRQSAQGSDFASFGVTG